MELLWNYCIHQALPNNYAFAAALVDIVTFVTFVTSYFETI